jgi:methionine biosynthesis protein MetW
MTGLRADLACIAPWIRKGARVLDLGCGNGEFLAWLQIHRQVQGYGLEIDVAQITECLARDVNVRMQDLDRGLGNFADQSFDLVVMTQALQALHQPHRVIDEMLRVGREAIVTFPNFGHWKCRTYLGLRGRMPVSEFMPYQWYDTPNIHFCTFEDFEILCEDLHIEVLRRQSVNQVHQAGWLSSRWPNLLGEVGIYHLRRKP